jgi:Bacterial aa3 type cytochrome c oxidase subunit IV
MRHPVTGTGESVMGKGRLTNRRAEDMADHHEGEHKHGSMDIRAQEKTFEGFIRMSVWVAVISIAILIFAGLVNG